MELWLAMYWALTLATAAIICNAEPYDINVDEGSAKDMRIIAWWVVRSFAWPITVPYWWLKNICTALYATVAFAITCLKFGIKWLKATTQSVFPMFFLMALALCSKEEEEGIFE